MVALKYLPEEHGFHHLTSGIYLLRNLLREGNTPSCCLLMASTQSLPERSDLYHTVVIVRGRLGIQMTPLGIYFLGSILKGSG